MTRQQLFSALRDTDAQMIADAAPETAGAIPEKAPRASWKKWAAIAACAAVILSAGIGTYAYAAEAKEYSEALEFFEQNALPTQGLTRSEIKEVHQDIVNNSFTNLKTAEVLENSLARDGVTGHEILQATPTPQDIEILWKTRNSTLPYGVTETGVSYRTFENWEPDSSGQDQFHESGIEKFVDGKSIWQAKTTEFSVFGYLPVRGGVVMWGQDVWGVGIMNAAKLMRVDDEGRTVWCASVNNGFKFENVSAVLEEADGSLAVFTNGGGAYICFNRIDGSGKVQCLAQNSISSPGLTLHSAVHFGDGYLLQLGTDTVVRADADGAITDTMAYSDGDAGYDVNGNGTDLFPLFNGNTGYHIQSMAVFGGKVWLSVYAYQLTDSEVSSGRSDIDPILEEVFAADTWDIPDETMTEKMRERFTAMLLVCDPDSGKQEEFYSVQGSIGGKLEAGADGSLAWDVESFTTAHFSPATNAYTIAAACQVFRYRFDEAGTLLGYEDTGEITGFYR